MLMRLYTSYEYVYSERTAAEGILPSDWLDIGDQLQQPLPAAAAAGC